MTTGLIDQLQNQSRFGFITNQTLRPQSTSPKFMEDNQDIFFKSQISLAETCQEDSHRRESFSDDISDNDCLSVRSHSCHSNIAEEQICQDFSLKGYCMLGEQCECIHSAHHNLENKGRARTIRLWVMKEMPEIAVGRWKRVSSFLN